MDSSLPLTHQALIMQIGLPQTDTCTYSITGFNVFLQQGKPLPLKKLQSGVSQKDGKCELQSYGSSYVIKVTDINNSIIFLYYVI